MKKYLEITKKICRSKGIFNGMMLFMLMVIVNAPTMRCTLFLNEPKEPKGIEKIDLVDQIMKHNQ